MPLVLSGYMGRQLQEEVVHLQLLGICNKALEHLPNLHVKDASPAPLQLQPADGD